MIRKPITAGVLIVFNLLLVLCFWDPFPYGKQATDLSLKVSCQANLKAIDMGLRRYANDHHGMLPPPADLYSALVPKYVDKEFFICPLRERYMPNLLRRNGDYIAVYGRKGSNNIGYPEETLNQDIVIVEDRFGNHAKSTNDKVANAINTLRGCGWVTDTSPPKK